MSRTSPLVRLVAALIGIVAIAVAAATITSPTETGGSDGVGFGSGGAPAYTPPPGDAGAGSVPPFLEYLLAAVVVLLAIGLAWYLVAHRRELVTTLAVTFLVLALVAALAIALQQFAGTDATNLSRPVADGDVGLSSGGSSDEGETSVPPFGSALALLAVVAAIFAGALVLTRSDDLDETDDDGFDPEPVSDDAAGIGVAAGRAADRIARSAAVDNEVYRAWREMTSHLEVDSPETSTPREFAAAAVEAGLDREDVDELTRLFEDVRYGHRETTDELEARAVEILRRIEATYADEAADDASRTRGDRS